MLVVQSLASSQVSMVIVAGDPFTATKIEKEKKTQVMASQVLPHSIRLSLYYTPTMLHPRKQASPCSTQYCMNLSPPAENQTNRDSEVD